MKLPAFYPIVDTVPAAEALLEAGARILQFRHKGFFSRSVFEEASRIAELCRSAGALFVVNDRADIAGLLKLDCIWARRIFRRPTRAGYCPPRSVIGFSTHNEQTIARRRFGARRLSGNRSDFRHRIKAKSRSGSGLGWAAKVAAAHAKAVGRNRRHHPRIGAQSFRSGSRLGSDHRRLVAGCARARGRMDRD